MLPQIFSRKTNITFILCLMMFEPLDLKQNYITDLKVLLGGINVSELNHEAALAVH